MISVSEALALVLERCETKLPERATLREAVGLVLAQDVSSDVDSPPHDKSLVDGYAIRAADVARVTSGRVEGPVELLVIEEVTAGAVPQIELASGQATRIMTGAPIPDGADAVVMVERTRWKEEAGTPLGVVQIDDEEVAAEQFIMRRATAMRRGQQVLAAGCTLRDVEVGLLAEVGCGDVMAVPRPRVAVLATGNELVDVTAVPTAGKIRNSNGPMLLAAAEQAGGWGVDLGVARDDEASLRELIGQGLESDVLILSVGVSSCDINLVPKVFTELGVEEVFHKVRIKPGKPIWFGVTKDEGEGGSAAARPTLVFGLPGNPVSSLVCFRVFVAPVLSLLAGQPGSSSSTFKATLVSEFRHRGGRPTYHPARIEETDAGLHVRLLAWHGSSDLRTLAEAQALVLFPEGDRLYLAGETVECMHF